MSDFDFDELDKAVHGALNGPATPPTAADAPQAASSQSQTQPPTPPQFQATVPAGARGSVASTPVETALPASSLSFSAARRATTAGRFMDMVHPSSDMRNNRSTDSVADSAAPIAPTLLGAVPTEATPVNEIATKAEAVTEATTEATAAPANNSADTPEDALVSPFLPDAKVEKRPLGGALGSAELTFEDVKLPPVFPQTLLEEPDAETLIEEAEPQPLLEEIEFQPLLETTDESLIPTNPENATNTTPVAPASIQQQYVERPSSAPETGPIYDTQLYHQPVSIAAKKTSGVWVFIWIILLIIAGAAAAIGLYIQLAQ